MPASVHRTLAAANTNSENTKCVNKGQAEMLGSFICYIFKYYV